VGQLISRKGHHFLIQAVAHLRAKFPHLKLFIIGEGSSEEPIRRTISKLGLEQYVSLVGAVKNEELFRWYSAADVTCLASSREGFPCVLLESLACGTPVVATAIEGTSELVNSLDLGLLVQQDSVSLSEGLERALQIGWVKTALASHARSFTWQQTAVAIEEI
jgi:glycosyltransferase involved in cell wall biosynthesis